MAINAFQITKVWDSRAGHVALPENRIANDSHKSIEGACFFLLKWP